MPDTRKRCDNCNRVLSLEGGERWWVERWTDNDSVPARYCFGSFGCGFIKIGDTGVGLPKDRPASDVDQTTMF